MSTSNLVCQLRLINASRAVLRIRAELERCAGDKVGRVLLYLLCAYTKQRVWFLAPTVALCEQQHGYIQSRLPDTSPLILIGSSNVDYWSEQSIWDAALHNHRIVISTHAILLDAMRHGFVRLASLALLIFDEGKFPPYLNSAVLTLVQAHHCNGKHPANLIMQGFYHPEKRDKGPNNIPHILGLSASPVRRSKLQEIQYVLFTYDRALLTPSSAKSSKTLTQSA